jgi:CheY-like chemotaxis protein
VAALFDRQVARLGRHELLGQKMSNIVPTGDPDLKTIPIVILTTSDAESDITRSYQLQANCYLTEPVRLEEFENLVKSVNDFWLTKVKLNSGSGVR